MCIGDGGDTSSGHGQLQVVEATVVGMGDGGDWNERFVCLLMMTNQASGFADAQFAGANELQDLLNLVSCLLMPA